MFKLKTAIAIGSRYISGGQICFHGTPANFFKKLKPMRKNLVSGDLNNATMFDILVEYFPKIVVSDPKTEIMLISCDRRWNYWQEFVTILHSVFCDFAKNIPRSDGRLRSKNIQDVEMLSKAINLLLLV